MNEKRYFTFVVLHYNCFEETKVCIDSIKKLDQNECVKIVVMDNASVNDSLRQLKSTYGEDTQISILHNEKNMGFSAGNNRAYQYAREHWCSEFVVFANNDLLFEDRAFIAKVREEYQKSHFGVLSPDIFHTTLQIHQSPIDEKMALPVARVRKTIWFNQLALCVYPMFYAIFRGRLKETAETVENLSYRKNIVPMGACIIVSEVLMDKKETIFSPETYFYYEEYILSYWCKKHGVDIVFQPEIQVLHNHGQATKSLGDDRKIIRFRMNNILQAAKVYYKLITSQED